MLNKILILLGVMLVSLQADYVLQYNMDTDVSTFMYKDANHAKMITPPGEDGSTEIYSINKKTYIVSQHNGVLSIVDVDKAKSFIDSMGVSFVQEQQDEGAGFSFKKTGKKQKVAGINGEIWILNDEGRETRIVVSNNKKLVQMTQKMFDMLSKMSGESKNMYEIEKGYVIIMGEGMILESFEEKKLPSSTYELPSTSKSKSSPVQNTKNEKQASALVQESKKTVRLRPVSDDPCFADVCCKRKAGESKILKQYLHNEPQNMFVGFELYEAAACKGQDTEDALFVRGDGREIIRVTLNMNDKKGGVIKNINLQRHQSASNDINGIEWWSEGEWYNKTYQGRIVKTKQAYLDYIINDTTSLSFTSKNEDIDLGPLDLYGNVDIKGIIFHFNPHLKDEEGAVSSKSDENTKSQDNEDAEASLMDSVSDADIDKAANFLKSFF
ncbi:hypothetical protein KJ877_06090 [bacterium]|nr:hypothetical protein [bacterium]MBU1989755.1 hypothetical protein [bacterium]